VLRWNAAKACSVKCVLAFFLALDLLLCADRQHVIVRQQRYASDNG
jgi:hypothetical protein